MKFMKEPCSNKYFLLWKIYFLNTNVVLEKVLVRNSALLTYLSKAFDCLNRELLTAKLKAYGFTLPALKIIYNCLPN